MIDFSRIKTFICRLEDVLLQSDGTISDEDALWLARAVREESVNLIILSGLPYSEVIRLCADKLGVPFLVLCEEGKAFHAADGSILVSHAFSPSGRTLALDVSKALGVPVSFVMALGRDKKDIQVIETCGVGVSMEDSPFEVKIESDMITLSSSGMGVSQLVKRIVFDIDAPVVNRFPR